MKINEGSKYLVTGGSGFLGGSLIERILSLGGHVRVLARNEGKLIELRQKYPSVEISPGDISDFFEVKQAFAGISGVFHLAASKHVGLAETYVRECVKSNVIGTMNVLEASLDHSPDFVVGISTDKAAQVSGVYGATKLLMERLFKQFEEINEATQYRIVRYGNVLYSTGSVLCKWKSLLEDDQAVVITDENATRFVWTREEAVDLIFECMESSTTSDPYVPDMKAMRMGDLLEAMSIKYLPSGAVLKIRHIGLQPGENLHEKILEEGPYSSEVASFTVQEIIEKI